MTKRWIIAESLAARVEANGPREESYLRGGTLEHGLNL